MFAQISRNAFYFGFVNNNPFQGNYVLLLWRLRVVNAALIIPLRNIFEDNNIILYGLTIN